MSRQFATNVTTIYDIFCPVPFLPSPFGFRRFVLRFVGDGGQKKITKNPRHFSMQNSQANTKKKIHKILLESRQSKLLWPFFGRLSSKGNFRHKMTTIEGNRGQLWTSTSSPHLLSPHVDVPNLEIRKA